MMKSIFKACFNSATVAISYVTGAVGIALDTISEFPDVVGDQVKSYLSDAFGGDPKHTGRILLGVSVATFLARMRSLRKKSDG